MSGIYKIESKSKPERAYIGSALNIPSRWKTHLHTLRLNKHDNMRLQNHYNKYGESDLVFSIIEPCLPMFLTIREQHYINELDPLKRFNICPVAGNCLGRVFSEESILLMSKSHLGKATWNKGKKTGLISPNVFKKGEMTGEKNPFFGKHHSEETNQNNSNAHKGQEAWNKGKTGIYSEQTLMNIAKSLQGNKNKLNKKVSEEALQNMRDAWVIRKLKKSA